MASPISPSLTTTTAMVDRILRQSDLSQAELARRAGLPRSVLNAYRRGHRQPGADMLMRIAAAAGLDLQLAPRSAPVDAELAGRRLKQVLELAEALPFTRDQRLPYPRLPAPGQKTRSRR